MLEAGSRSRGKHAWAPPGRAAQPAFLHAFPVTRLPAWCRDTAGQERYESLAPLYYRGATAAAVVYDVGSERSFRRAAHWVAELARNSAGTPLLVLVGNKSDLAQEERAVGGEEAAALAERCAPRSAAQRTQRCHMAGAVPRAVVGFGARWPPLAQRS